MKTLGKFLMLLIVLAICSPTYGLGESAVLIYKKTLDCWDSWEFDPNEWYTQDDKVQGFLVIEVSYDLDGTILEVVDSAQIEYWKNGRNKWYILNEHEFNVFSIVEDGSVEWVLVESATDEDQGELTMLRGRVRNGRIGNENPREVARRLTGHRVGFWFDATDEVLLCKWSLRLQQRWTKLSNENNYNIEDAVNNIADWLEDKGYEITK
jgi:hypothetical protein